MPGGWRRLRPGEGSTMRGRPQCVSIPVVCRPGQRRQAMTQDASQQVIPARSGCLHKGDHVCPRDNSACCVRIRRDRSRGLCTFSRFWWNGVDEGRVGMGERGEVGTTITNLIAAMPKVELHVHLEGCITPKMALHFARKNRWHYPYESIEQALRRDGVLGPFQLHRSGKGQ